MMKNYRQFLHDNIWFEAFATTRALDVLRAKKEKRNFELENISFYYESVVVTLVEITRHDCPDYEKIPLTLEQLEMSDIEWYKIYKFEKYIPIDIDNHINNPYL